MYSACRPMFVIENAQGEGIFTIDGSCCRVDFICCQINEFLVSDILFVLFLLLVFKSPECGSFFE